MKMLPPSAPVATEAETCMLMHLMATFTFAFSTGYYKRSLLRYSLREVSEVNRRIGLRARSRSAADPPGHFAGYFQKSCAVGARAEGGRFSGVSTFTD